MAGVTRSSATVDGVERQRFQQHATHVFLGPLTDRALQ